ncbi:hypothetical protein AArcCO_4028 (plasmid) [Halalkaliarchaeum sp. AArc-CO]|nr:hypothetical protein AArcCO_4028 [Halalkaliarchaeum sp. AArc-CO]
MADQLLMAVGFRIGGFGLVAGRIGDCSRATLATTVALWLSGLLDVLSVARAETAVGTGMDDL